jgi:2-succinyl-6-hydroxy-2,4-cyclohexadiene-1-carboxylate synthase
VTSLVLLHGFTGSPDSFAELLHGVCSRQPRLRVLSPWLLGHGSAPELGPQRFEAEVDRLASLVRAARFSGAHLCGYSLGARVALGLLARHPYLFAGATLIGVNPGLGDPAERAARIGGDERWARLLLREGMSGFLSAWQAQPLFESQVQLSAAALAQQRRIRAQHTARGLGHSLRVLGLGQMPDYRGVLHGCCLPVRLVVGDLDRKFLEIARELSGLTGAALDCVPGAGHNLLLEAPEQVAGVLTRALEAAS